MSTNNLQAALSKSYRRDELQKAAAVLEKIDKQENRNSPNISNSNLLIENKNEVKAIRLSDLPLFTCQSCYKIVEVDSSIEESLKEMIEKLNEENQQNEEEFNEEEPFTIQDYFIMNTEKTNTNHPYCSDCAYFLYKETMKNIEDFQNENSRYINYTNYINFETNDINSIDDEILQVCLIYFISILII